MNATVITTGPGVIIETATASMNCRSVSQWNWWTTPPYRNGTIASPLPNTKRLAPAKYVRIFQSTPTDAGPPRPVVRPGAAGRNASARVAGARGCPRSSIGTSPHTRKIQMISDQRHPHEFQRTAGDDGNHGGADPVEQPLHPRQPAEADVQLGQHEHHQKRGRYERDPCQRRAEHPAPYPSEVDRELSGERARGELRKGEALLVLLRADPAALLHEV